MGNTYGYDILKGKELVVHQSYNPFTLSPLGLSKKEDVYKLAKWQIKQLKERKQLSPGSPFVQNKGQKLQTQVEHGPTINQLVPQTVAQELQIDFNH